MLASLHSAVFGMQQLSRQLAAFARVQAADPSLYDDRRDRPGAQTALELADALDGAVPAAARLAEQLSRAAGIGSHLGNDR